MTSLIQRLAAAQSHKTRKPAMTMPKVPKPQPVRKEVNDNEFFETTSYRAQIENLDVGESFARARRFDFDTVSKAVLEETSRGMRLATQPTVFRISKRTGREYTIEAGDFRTLTRDIIVVLAVTRTA